MESVPPPPPPPSLPPSAGALSVDGRPAGDPLPSTHAGLTVGRLLEVDVGVAQRAAGDHVAADADGEDGPGRRELLVQHRLGHIGV